MRRPLARTLVAAALAVAGAAGPAGACNPAAYNDYALGGPGGPGGVGGSAGQGAACNGFYSNDAACQGCFEGSRCCTQAGSCDEDCKKYVGCQSQCAAGDADCEASCKDRFSFGPGEVERLLGCLSDECSQCGGLLSESGAIGNPPGGGAGAAGGPGQQRCQVENACVNAACLDCDQADGAGSCETDTNVSKTNCGVCGRDCLTASCVDGQCLSASALNAVHVSTRLASGGGYLYWVSTKSDDATLKGDTIFRANVASNGSPEVAFEPAGALTIYDLAADATHFYFVSNLGLRMREHGVVAQPVALAAELDGLLGGPTAEPRAAVAANGTTVYVTTPLATGEGDGTRLWAVPKAAGATAVDDETFSSSRVSMLVADEGGVYVGSSDRSVEPGVWYVAPGQGKQNIFAGAAGEFAIGGDDMIVVNVRDFEARVVALPKAGGAETELALRQNSSIFRAVAADASGLYYLVEDPETRRAALRRVRRQPAAAAFDAPVELLTEVTRAGVDLPIALDASWVYGPSSDGTSVWHVPKMRARRRGATPRGRRGVQRLAPSTTARSSPSSWA